MLKFAGFDAQFQRRTQTIKEMMETEMEDHLGYEKSARSENDDSRNGYKSKRLTTSYGPNGNRSAAGPEIDIRAEGGKEAAEGYIRDRPEDHFDVR